MAFLWQTDLHFSFCAFPNRLKFSNLPHVLLNILTEYIKVGGPLFCVYLYFSEFAIVIQVQFSSVQLLSHVPFFAQSCPILCDPMNRSTPGLPVHHQLPEFTQTHVHPVSDALQPSHPLSSPSPPAPTPAQHQSLFQ